MDAKTIDAAPFHDFLACIDCKKADANTSVVRIPARDDGTVQLSGGSLSTSKAKSEQAAKMAAKATEMTRP